MIVCGDSIEELKLLETDSVDFVVTDPPYNIGKDYGNDSDKQLDEDYDNWLGQIGKEVMRVATPEAWILVFNGVTKIKTTIEAFGEQNHVWTACWYAPNKRSRGSYGYNLWQPLTMYRTLGRKWLKLRDFYSYTTGQEDYGHPTPKPLKLIKKLILDFSEEGDLVLDPFLGSGTTAVACQALGRDCIGIEINEEYVKIAERRLEIEKSQLKLNF